MKKMTTLGAAALLSVASIGAQAQVQTLNDAALSEISGQGMGLYTGLVEGTGPFIKAAAVDAAVNVGALVAAPTVAALATGLNAPLAAATYVAGPAIAAASLLSIVPAQATIFAVAPVAATAALIKGRLANGADGTGIKNATKIMAASTAAIIAAPVAGVGIAATALAVNGPAAVAVLASGPVIAAGALTAGAATMAVSGASFVHHGAHVVGRTAYNGVQMVKAHLNN